MQTENLNEIIQQESKQRFNIDDPDYVYTLSREKLTYDDVKNEISPKAEANPETQIVPQGSVEEATTSNFEPESEEALIAYTADIHNRVQTVSIGGYWEIGRTINSFYKGKYGTNELERIAQATGIGRDTLAKACRFARQYSKDDVENLLKGKFVIPWGQIAQNLTVSPQKVIEVYQTASDKGQFYNGIIKLKDPSESRGKRRSGSAKTAAVIMEALPTISIPSASSNPIDHKADRVYREPVDVIDVVDAVKVPEVNDSLEKEIQSLRDVNDSLRKELDHVKIQLGESERLFNEACHDLDASNELVEKLKDKLNQVHDMIENEWSPDNILMEINWRI